MGINLHGPQTKDDRPQTTDHRQTHFKSFLLPDRTKNYIDKSLCVEASWEECVNINWHYVWVLLVLHLPIDYLFTELELPGSPDLTPLYQDFNASLLIEAVCCTTPFRRKPLRWVALLALGTLFPFF